MFSILLSFLFYGRCVYSTSCNDMYVLYVVSCNDVHDVECDGMDV